MARALGGDIPLTGGSFSVEGSARHATSGVTKKTAFFIAVGAGALFGFAGFAVGYWGIKHTSPAPAPANHLRLPKGVNLGGWLCLEDWFYSGANGHFVSSSPPDGQGACLPPMVSGLDTPWQSEGLLTFQLNKTHGPDFVVKAFEAHRHSFVGDSDLKAISELGISLVRVPITWAVFADRLAPLDQALYGSHNPNTTTALVPDPFYSDVAMFATTPRDWLAQLCRRAAFYGLQLLFDLHAFPGGSADGTYSGIWPNQPQFWKNTTKVGNSSNFSIPLTEVGLWVVEGLVQWVEGLDDDAMAGIGALTLMNEPAHMAAIDAQNGHPFANESTVLAWLTNATQIFRNSSLPGKGVQLYVQMIETAFQDFDKTAVPWFLGTFSESERRQWAVIDIHHYMAWDQQCSGRVTAGGGYWCDQPIDEIEQKLQGCINGWAQSMPSRFPNTLLACSEFSVGTYATAREACTDPQVLKAFLKVQLAAFSDNSIQAYFWTWKMPFGSVFEPGWSLKRLAGLQDPNTLPCQGTWVYNVSRSSQTSEL